MLCFQNVCFQECATGARWWRCYIMFECDNNEGMLLDMKCGRLSCDEFSVTTGGSRMHLVSYLHYLSECGVSVPSVVLNTGRTYLHIPNRSDCVTLEVQVTPLDRQTTLLIPFWGSAREIAYIMHRVQPITQSKGLKKWESISCTGPHTPASGATIAERLWLWLATAILQTVSEGGCTSSMFVPSCRRVSFARLVWQIMACAILHLLQLSNVCASGFQSAFLGMELQTHKLKRVFEIGNKLCVMCRAATSNYLCCRRISWISSPEGNVLNVPSKYHWCHLN